MLVCKGAVKNIPEQYLLEPHTLKDFSSANLQAACEAMVLDCLNFIFNHADLGLTNIIVEGTSRIPGKLGSSISKAPVQVTFLEAGSGTKFRISSRMDNLSRSVADGPYSYWWRGEVQKSLGANGF
ncbi:hypothetical protein AJ80_01646 [Polytolypa hystricis UAMH7299]|uniref:Uncharacterized protein n=1 Tax=Polytolypa hystricis (strain UAMH7299) TaxID=1447883 RepID=A0A2B7YZW2_POLH7|nr:hypothetical protein AJ80_01646 [Polytolypa hystricis UAMH7299]